MKLFNRKEKKELPSEYKAMMRVFDKVYDSPEYKDRRKDMTRWLELYEGEMWDEKIFGKRLKDKESRAQVNYIFSTVETVVPVLTDNKPIWYVRADYPVFQNMANIYNKAGDYLWDFLEMDHVLFLVEKNACIWPVGILETYWDPETDNIAVEVIDSREFVIAPGYDDLWKTPWCGLKMKKPLSWAKEKYPDKYAYIETDNETSSSDHEKKQSIELEDEYFTLYKMWIKDESVEQYIEEQAAIRGENGEIIQEATQVKKKRKKYPNGRIVLFTKECMLYDDNSPFEHGKPPWTPFYDYRVPMSFWGMGEANQIEYLHKEYNRQLQTAVKWARLAEDPNYLVDENAHLNIEEIKDEFADGGNMWACNLTGYGANEAPIRKVEMGQMDRAALELLRIIPNAIEEVSSATDLLKGMPSKKERQSATELSILTESSHTRTRQKIRNLEWSLKRLFYLFVSLMQQNYTSPRYFSYKTGDEEGTRLDYGLIGNSPNMFRESNTPERIKLEGGEEETEGEYQERLGKDKTLQETERLIEETFGEIDRVHFGFTIEIQTNSTLPKDKQSLANLYLRLAEVKTTPNSIVDDIAVMEQLQIPDKEAIKNRKEKEKKNLLAAKQGQARVQTGGPRPIPIGGQAPAPPQIVRR